MLLQLSIASIGSYMLFPGANMQVPRHCKAALLLPPIYIINFVLAARARMHTGAKAFLYGGTGALKCA